MLRFESKIPLFVFLLIFISNNYSSLPPLDHLDVIQLSLHGHNRLFLPALLQLCTSAPENRIELDVHVFVSSPYEGVTALEQELSLVGILGCNCQLLFIYLSHIKQL